MPPPGSYSRSLALIELRDLPGQKLFSAFSGNQSRINLSYSSSREGRRRFFGSYSLTPSENEKARDVRHPGLFRSLPVFIQIFKKIY